MHASNFKLRAKRKNKNEGRKNLNKLKKLFWFPLTIGYKNNNLQIENKRSLDSLRFRSDLNVLNQHACSPLLTRPTQLVNVDIRGLSTK